jgi:hypothetical protein
MSALSLPQRLGLVKFLTDTLVRLRKDELLPQSEAEMPPGSRLPVMFGGRHAGWASMPAASTSASVSDEKALLAWAEKNHPGKVSTVETVEVTGELLAHLEDHFPAAVVKTRQVDPHWVSDIQGALKDRGYYVTLEGEKLTEVPGIRVSTSEPSPRVNLASDAAGIIAAAWRAGDIPVDELLALPAADGEAAA